MTESVALPPDGPAPCSTRHKFRLPRDDFDPKVFLGRAEPGRIDRAIREEPEDIQPGRRRRRRLLHPQGQGEDHGACPNTARKRWSGFSRRDSSSARHVSKERSVRTTTSHAMEDCLITSITKPAMLAALHFGAEVFGILHRLSAVPKQPDRRRSDRPAVQFQREAAGAPAAAARQFRPGWRRTADRDQPQSGDPGGNDRHHAIARQFLHEPSSGRRDTSTTTARSRFTVRCWTRCCATSRKCREDE